jgi:hypothetical protein
MANPTLATLKTACRTLVSDSDATNYGVSDAELTVLLNEAQQLYGAVYPEDIGWTIDTATIGQSSKSLNITVDADCRAVIRAHRTAALGPMLERKSVQKIIEQQNNDPTEGTISEYAIERSPDSITTFIFYPWPIPAPATTDIYIFSLKDIEDIDANGSIWGTFAGYTIARIAAVSHAMILGRYERVANLEKQLPERVQLYMKIHRIAMRPAAESGEATVGG